MASFMSTDVSLWVNFLLFAAYLEELSGDCGTFVILKDANKYSLLFIKWSYWDFGANKRQCLRLFQCHAWALQPKLLAYFSSFRERGRHAPNILPQNGGPVSWPTILFCHWIQSRFCTWLIGPVLAFENTPSACPTVTRHSVMFIGQRECR